MNELRIYSFIIAFSVIGTLNISVHAMQKPRGWSEDLAIAKAQRDNEQARAAARKKLSDSRLSWMQKEYAHHQDYQIKVSNKSPYTINLAVLIGTPNRFNFIAKPLLLYPQTTWVGTTNNPSVVIKNKWPLSIQVTTPQRGSLLLLDKKRNQQIAEFTIDADEAVEYLELDNGTDYYHFYIRKPEDKKYYEILTPGEYRNTIHDRRYEYYV